jgi:hypothetical protein
MEHVRGRVLDGDKVIAKDIEITAVGRASKAYLTVGTRGRST